MGHRIHAIFLGYYCLQVHKQGYFGHLNYQRLARQYTVESHPHISSCYLFE
ncbi:hypothetical protein HanPSC8_Chr08g0323931 [Helianthus annuus]|nr:hypothetical protein HanPSC8_Chr08g0323931 [Helianthus annuus]